MIPRRKGLKKSTKPIRKSPIKRKPRPAAETLRVNGPPGYREFLMAHGCLLGSRLLRLPNVPPCSGKMDACHTVNDGKGRKGHFSTQIPGCRTHHLMYDGYKAPFQRDSLARESAKLLAGQIYREWLKTHPESESYTLATGRDAGHYKLVQGDG